MIKFFTVIMFAMFTSGHGKSIPEQLAMDLQASSLSKHHSKIVQDVVKEDDDKKFSLVREDAMERIRNVQSDLENVLKELKDFSETWKKDEIEDTKRYAEKEQFHDEMMTFEAEQDKAEENTHRHLLEEDIQEKQRREKQEEKMKKDEMLNAKAEKREEEEALNKKLNEHTRQHDRIDHLQQQMKKSFSDEKKSRSNRIQLGKPIYRESEKKDPGSNDETSKVIPVPPQTPPEFIGGGPPGTVNEVPMDETEVQVGIPIHLQDYVIGEINKDEETEKAAEKVEYAREMQMKKRETMKLLLKKLHSRLDDLKSSLKKRKREIKRQSEDEATKDEKNQMDILLKLDDVEEKMKRFFSHVQDFVKQRHSNHH